MSWIIHGDRHYGGDLDNALSIQTNVNKCCQRVSSSTPKLNLSLLADKFVEKIVGKLSILDRTKRAQKKSNDKGIDKGDEIWPFIKHMILFILIIGFYYLMINIDHRHRHMSAIQNGSMLVGPSYHSSGNSYFFLNISKSIMSTSGSPAAFRMDDGQFIRYLFNNIQLWID